MLSTNKEVKRLLHEDDFTSMTDFANAFEAETKMPVDEFMKLAWTVTDPYQSEWRFNTGVVYILCISHDEHKYVLYREI